MFLTESESFTSGVGSKSKPCTKFFRFKSQNLSKTIVLYLNVICYGLIIFFL